MLILASLVFVIGASGCGQETSDSAQTPANEAAAANPDAPKEAIDINQMVDCGKMEDPGCFMNRMNGCLPVTARMTASDGSTEIEMIILGVENETCHFQRKLNNVLNLNCYFPKGTMNWDTIDQTFGNDKGLQNVVDAACKSGW